MGWKHFELHNLEIYYWLYNPKIYSGLCNSKLKCFRLQIYNIFKIIQSEICFWITQSYVSRLHISDSTIQNTFLDNRIQKCIPNYVIQICISGYIIQIENPEYISGLSNSKYISRNTLWIVQSRTCFRIQKYNLEYVYGLRNPMFPDRIFWKYISDCTIQNTFLDNRIQICIPNRGTFVF